MDRIDFINLCFKEIKEELFFGPIPFEQRKELRTALRQARRNCLNKLLEIQEKETEDKTCSK